MEATDGSGASVRVVLFDYQKAFDFVDHTIILDKLKSLDILNSTINWISVSFTAPLSPAMWLVITQVERFQAKQSRAIAKQIVRPHSEETSCER